MVFSYLFKRHLLNIYQELFFAYYLGYGPKLLKEIIVWGENKLNRQLQQTVINVTNGRHINVVGIRVTCCLTQNIWMINLIGLYFLYLILNDLTGKMAKVSRRWELFICCSWRKVGNYKCIECQLYAGPLLGVFFFLVF